MNKIEKQLRHDVTSKHHLRSRSLVSASGRSSSRSYVSFCDDKLVIVIARTKNLSGISLTGYISSGQKA